MPGDIGEIGEIAEDNGDAGRAANIPDPVRTHPGRDDRLFLGIVKTNPSTVPYPDSAQTLTRMPRDFMRATASSSKIRCV